MAPPPSTPRAPPPTPMSPRYHSSTSSSLASNSSSSSSSGSSYTGTSDSYFSNHAPHTVPRSHPSSSDDHSNSYSVDFTKPFITSSVTSNMNAVASMPFSNPPYAAHHHHHHTQPLPHTADALRHFASHIPAPPSLNMPPKKSSRTPASSNSSLSSNSSGTSGSQTPSNAAPDMVCQTEMTFYTLMVASLPPSITSDMVTISANKGDRLRINAQAWGGENAAHYEWQISFPPRDVDLSRVQARFDNGGLTVRVPRWSRGW